MALYNLVGNKINSPAEGRFLSKSGWSNWLVTLLFHGNNASSSLAPDILHYWSNGTWYLTSNQMIWVQLPYSAYPINATLVKLADTQDLSSCFSNEVWVQVPQVVLRDLFSQIWCCLCYYCFHFFWGRLRSPTLLLQSKSVRHGADLLSHAILYWIEFRVFCFALSHKRIINKDKKRNCRTQLLLLWLIQ